MPRKEIEILAFTFFRHKESCVSYSLFYLYQINQRKVCSHQRKQDDCD